MRNLIPDLKKLGLNSSKQLKRSGSINASVLFVDISGFTAMTRKLMEQGKEGAEILSKFMNVLFDPLIDAVYSHGGFITNFAGDAFTAVFRNDKGIQAVGAAVEIRSFFLTNPVLENRGWSFKVSSKAGISKGRLNWTLAEADSIEHFLFFGRVVDEAAMAEHCCCGNTICIDRKVRNSLGDTAICSCEDRGIFVENISSNAVRTDQEIKVDPDVLKRFIPNTVLEQTIHGEFREVVSLFISYTVPEKSVDINDIIGFFASSVQKYGGYISGFDSGDKGSTLLALFGAPVSYEDNLERAVNCIAHIRKNCSIRMRSGITEGIAYAGFTGSTQRSAYTALGDDVNLAARLMMAAPFGSDWVTGKAAQKISNTVELESAGCHLFKGMEREIEVFTIKGRLKKDESVSFSTAFTGRSAELSSLVDAGMNASQFSRLEVYCVYGEPGIGKSRLIYEVRKRLEKDFTVFNLNTDTILRQSMNMFNQFFQRFFEQNENLSAEENLRNFEKKWEGIVPDQAGGRERFESLKPYIGALAGVFWKGSVYDILDAKSRYENTLFAVSDLFGALSEQKPLMIVLDDMHAVDSDSLEVIKTMVKRLSGSPVVIYMLARLNDDGSRTDFLPGGESKTFVIDRLLESDVRMFIENVLGGPAGADLVKFVFARSSGNPFFMEQLVLFMNERGYLVRKDEVFSLKKDDIEVPGEVNSLLVSRLDRLTAKLKDLVFKASVLGNDIDLLVLDEVAGEKSMVDLLKEGVGELIWNEVSKVIYSFRHALLRDAAYYMQLTDRLKDIHRKVACAIENNYPGEDRFFSSLAFHYEKAGDAQNEMKYLRKAADYAKAQYHNSDAAKMYEKLMTRLEKDEDLIETGHLLGNVYKISGKWDLAEKIFRESLNRALTLKDELLSAASMKELAYMLLEKGRYDEAQPLLDEAVDLYRKLGVVKGEGDVEGYRGLIHYYKGELDDAIEHFTKRLKLAETIDDKNAKALSYRYLGGVSYYRSDYKTALDYYCNQLAISKETCNILDIAVAENNLGLVYSHLNDFRNAAHFYQKALDTYRKISIRQYICYTSNNLGELKFWLGEYDEAEKLFREQLNIATELGIKRHISIAYNCLGNISRKKQDFVTAENFYDKAIAIGEELNVQTILCEYYYEKASLLYESEKLDEALVLAEKALKMSAEVNRLDFHFRSELLKWKIISHSDREKAVEMMRQMMNTSSKNENIAELNYHLYMLTLYESYFEKAYELFEGLFNEAPKAAYRERIESLKSMKG